MRCSVWGARQCLVDERYFVEVTSCPSPVDTARIILVRKGITCILGQTESHVSRWKPLPCEVAKSEPVVVVDALFHFHVPSHNSVNPFWSSVQIVTPEEQQLIHQTHLINLSVLVDDHLCQPNDAITKAMHVSNEEFMHYCMDIDVVRQ